MSWRNLLGAVAFTGVFAAAFLAGDGRQHFLNGIGLVLVVSGTLGATFLSFPVAALGSAFRVAWNTYRIAPMAAGEIVEALIDISLRSRRDGFLSLERIEQKTDVSFLKSALGMLVDGYEEREMRDVLTTEMYFFRRRRQEHERVFRHMARLAPAFGVAGSVVGLIGMLMGLGDTGVILKTIPLALTSTLYGIVLCNLALTPIAESIHFKTQQELLLQKLIIEGVVAIRQEGNSQKLERKLTSFLTPSARLGSQRSFEQIRQKYRRLQLGEDSVPAS